MCFYCANVKFLLFQLNLFQLNKGRDLCDRMNSTTSTTTQQSTMYEEQRLTTRIWNFIQRILQSIQGAYYSIYWKLFIPQQREREPWELNSPI